LYLVVVHGVGVGVWHPMSEYTLIYQPWLKIKSFGRGSLSSLTWLEPFIFAAWQFLCCCDIPTLKPIIVLEVYKQNYHIVK